MDKTIINKIFETFSQNNTSPKIELNYTNNFTLLVAIVLSAQSTDVGVNKATVELFKAIITPHDVLRLGEEGFKPYVKTIGLYNSKTKNILKLSQMLVDKYGSKVPENYDDLKSLPGVGSKTAKVFLNSIFGAPMIAVDTHVFRVSRRIGLTHKTNVQNVEKDLEAQIPEKWKRYASHWLVLHGRYICKARKPMCEKCFLREYCEYYTTMTKGV